MFSYIEVELFIRFQKSLQFMNLNLDAMKLVLNDIVDNSLKAKINEGSTNDMISFLVNPIW